MHSIIAAQKCGKNVIKIVFDNTSGQKYIGASTTAYSGAKYAVNLRPFETDGVDLDKPYKVFMHIKSETYDWNTTQVKPTDVYNFNITFDNSAHNLNVYQNGHGALQTTYDMTCRIRTSLNTYSGTNYENTYYESPQPDENGYKYIRNLRNINFMTVSGWFRGLYPISENSSNISKTQYIITVYLVED